jgi:Carboxypeptidase regulatory-like domain
MPRSHAVLRSTLAAVIVAWAMTGLAQWSGHAAGLQLTTNTNAACNAPQRPGFARCFAIVRTPTDQQITPDASGPPSTALGPSEIQSAYKLPETGYGQTVGIVDAYGDSTAESDLAAFRSYYGLPACTSANGCFKKVDQAGGTNYPPDDSGWGLETSLDLDAVSSACPACNILLVEANSDSFDDLGAAVDEAVALGAHSVSNSYGASESAVELSYDQYYNHPGVAITVSSGDVGNVTSWPSTNPNVVAVGGTTLVADTSTARGWDESAWGGADIGTGGGSGCSPYEPHPDFQNGISTDCATRAVADIAADADPASGLGVYDTLGEGGWLQVGGTSLASPLVAAMYALAGTPVAGTYPVTYPYHDPEQSSDLFDITQGANGACGNVLCTAGPGWDGPTGLGTPDGIKALVGAPQGVLTGEVFDAVTKAPVAGVSVTASPGQYSTTTDASGDYTLDLATGTYGISAAEYAYQTATETNVHVVANQTTTLSLALTELPHATVSGTVTDGSGHGWPLYAQITIDGYPGGPVYTNPFTGSYSVVLAGPATYSVQVTPAYPAISLLPGDGYLEDDTQLTVGTTSLTENFPLLVDDAACSAPGYGWNGLSESFTDWSGGTPKAGWKVTGSTPGWRFDNPGDRTPPSPSSGDDDFAVADSGYFGGRMNTTLVSPAVDLTGQQAPQLTFDTAYYAAPNQEAEVDLSTNGGKTWSTVWRQSSADAVGPVDIAIPQAAGKAKVQVRFQYSGDDGWWWAVDDVFVGTDMCVAEPGGVLAGLITDEVDGSPVDGATVVSATNPAVIGVAAETGDPNLPGAFYWLFSPLTGSRTFEVTATGFVSAKATLTLDTDQITSHAWVLTPKGA